MHSFCPVEYACQAFHSRLPAYFSGQIERVQKIILRILFPEVPYSKALVDTGIKTLFHRREELCRTLFKQILESNGKHKLACLLPPKKNSERYNLRNPRTFFFMPRVKTKGYGKTFIMHYANEKHMDQYNIILQYFLENFLRL